MKNNNLLTDMPVPSAFFKLAISAFASMGGAPKASIFMGKGNNECAEKVRGVVTNIILDACYFTVQNRALHKKDIRLISNCPA